LVQNVKRNDAMDLDAAARAMFFPRPDLPFEPDAPGAHEWMFEVATGIRQRIRVFPAADPLQAPDLLFFHGNGETARDYDGLAADYAALPVSLWVAEYRGYGLATGEPSLHTLVPDAHRALDEVIALRQRDGHRGPLVVMGRSLGSAPAIDLAAHRAAEIAGLIVESGFAHVVPLLELVGVPARQLGLTEEWGPRNLAKMADVTRPLLVLHAEDDELIPIAEAEALFAAARDPQKAFLRVPRAGHNDIQLRAGPAYFEAIATLLSRLR
jgi:fermentation-respiration switch protein FrsA (DUF1100 family)